MFHRIKAGHTGPKLSCDHILERVFGSKAEGPVPLYVCEVHSRAAGLMPRTVGEVLHSTATTSLFDTVTNVVRAHEPRPVSSHEHSQGEMPSRAEKRIFFERWKAHLGFGDNRSVNEDVTRNHRVVQDQLVECIVESPAIGSRPWRGRSHV